MKHFHYLIIAMAALAGCQFLHPDYLKTVNALELNRIMQDRDILLIDVHTPKQRHIKGTDLYIPFNEIENYQRQLPMNKNTAIFLYCEAGPMGNAAARSLYELGYRDLTNLEGGAKAWKQAGFDFE